MTSARRDRNGLLVPWAVDYFTGVEEAQRLSQEQGLSLDLDPDQVHALGVATAEQREAQAPSLGQDLVPTPELLEALDRLVAQRAAPTPAPGQGQDQALEEELDLVQPAPEPGLGEPSNIPTYGTSRSHTLGQGKTAAQQVQENSVDKTRERDTP